MPYDSIAELPANVRGPLPEGAQRIFREAFNDAWERYEDPSARRGDDSREEVSMKIAWGAVKRKYAKDNNGNWVEK